MLTIFKLTFANIRQKKFRTILIILSIILSVALMYSILSLSYSVKEVYLQMVKKEVGNAQIMITPKKNSGDIYVEKLNFDQQKGMEYHIPYRSAYGFTKLNKDSIVVSLTGMNQKDYDTVYGLEIIDQTANSLDGNQVYVGKEAADTYGLKLGDTLDTTISGKDEHFNIAGIVKDQNNSMSYEAGSLDLLISEKTLGTIVGNIDKYDGYFIKSLSGEKKETLLKELKHEFVNYSVNDVSDMSDFAQGINMIVSSLFIMVLSVIMVSAFIIYSSFKIIAIERMPLMGTMRSIGATRKMTVRTLIYESVFYGLAGGLIGNFLGVIMLSAVMKLILTNFGVSVENISYINPLYFTIAFIIGLVLAVGSALMPIIKMTNKSIKSIMFAEIQNEKHISIVKTLIGLSLIGAAFILFYHAPFQLQMLFDMIGIILVTVGGAMAIPMIAYILTKFISLILKPVFQDGIGVVTANIKNDRTMMNNIMLLSMGLSVILMINNFSSTIGSAVTDVYATAKADAVVFTNMDSGFIDKVRQVEGVEHVYTTKEINDITANNGKIKLLYVNGNDGRGYSQYAWNEFGTYLTDDVIDQYKSTRSIIISKFTARRYNLKEGDKLKIKFDKKEVNYEVIAIVPELMNNGNESFIYEKFLQEDAGVDNYQNMYINLDAHVKTKQVLQKIKELMPYGILPIRTLAEMKNQNVDANNALLYMMKAISIIAMFIGIIGILNNFTISFLSRRKLTATMRSLGLSRIQTIKNLLFESFLCGLLGTVSGLLLGTVLIKAMCFVVDAMGLPSDILSYNLKDYVFVLISGIIISMISSVAPAISITKENIVSGLRYE